MVTVVGAVRQVLDARNTLGSQVRLPYAARAPFLQHDTGGGLTSWKAVASFVLVHSPLVGPATWSWVAGELRRHGHDVVVPSLLAAATSGRWEACVRAVVAAAPPGPVVVVGHSGAGPLLPAIASQLDPSPSLLVFVDAAVPPTTGDPPLVPEQFLEALIAMAEDGVLPPWSEWFEPGTFEKLISDAARRYAVIAELPRLPLSYFRARVSVPARWAGAACAYVLLSDAYRHEADEAAARGWPVLEVLGSHMDLVTEPVTLARALRKLASTDSAPARF